MPRQLSESTLGSSEEDYLLAIARSEGPIKTGELAKKLSVSDASVTVMIARLAGKGLVSRHSHKPISLTEAGKQAALNLLRRHRLIELFLMKTLNYSWDEVHNEAHKLEHAVSDRFVERLDSFLGHPLADPHGSPIPQSDGSLPEVSRTPLEFLDPGQSARIAEVNDCDAELLEHLGKLGLTPGKRITVMERESFDHSVTLRLARRKIIIGRSVAHAIQVDEIDKNDLT